jgi:hypothetical protein
MKDIIQTIGGFLIVIIFPLLICSLWIDEQILIKLVVTNLVLIVLIKVIDGSMKD